MNIEIGSIVDWIDANTRFRGIVVNILSSSTACLCVVGVNGIFHQPLSRLVPVKEAKQLIKLLSDKKK